MALSQEIFRADLIAEVNVASAIKGLEELQQVASETVKALRSIEEIKVDVDTAGLDRITQAIRESTQEIKNEFAKLSREVVGRSIVPDMLDEIAKRFGDLPNRTDPEVRKLKTQFEGLKEEIDNISGDFSDLSRISVSAWDRIVESMMRMQGVKPTEAIDAAFSHLRKQSGLTDDEIKKPLESLKKLEEELGKLEFKQLKDIGERTFSEYEKQGEKFHNMRAQAATKEAEAIKKLGEDAFNSYEEQIKKANESIIQHTNQIGEIDQRWKAVSSIAAESINNLNRPLINLRSGIQLAFADGGNLALGFRQALFGISEPTNIVAKGLDWLGNRSNELSRAQGNLAKETERIANAMQNFSVGMRDQVDILKDAAKADGVRKETLNEIDEQVKNVGQAFTDMNVTIQSGGKPTERQMARIKETISILELSYRQLVAQGIIPAGSATDKMLQEMISGAKQQGISANQMVARVKALREQIDKTSQSQKKSSDEGEKQESIFKRFSISIGNLVGITRNVTNETTNLTKEYQDLGQQVAHTQSVMQTAKGAFVGFVGAAAAITGIRYAFDGLRFAIGGMARDFIEANTSAQSFEITLTSMLRGSDLQDQAEVVVGGALDFIKEQVASTPFELQDAMEAFNRLIIAGLDPQQWITPIADAAAIMEKPMDQLIGAFQRLVVGDTGQALAMMRDFGINVNNASALVDEATGRLLTFDEAAQLAGMTTGELAQVGVAELNLEFSKNGQLTTDTATALQILNGYLTQNASIAGTAAARSQSLAGVVSNLKDYMSNLFIEMGKPIFEKLTYAGTNLLSVLDSLKPTLNVLATSIGTWVATAVDSAINFIVNFRDTFSGLIETIQYVISFIGSIFAGDWPAAWSLFLSAIDNGLAQAEVLFDNLAMNAFTWGVNFIIEVANGVIDSVGSYLVDALNYVGDTISSFMAPGSPPEEGPLSTIDKWGQELMDLFGAGIEEIDTHSFDEALKDMKKVAEATGNELPENLIGSLQKTNWKGAIDSAKDQFKGLMGSFEGFNIQDAIGSLSSADFDFIGNALAPIKDVLKESLGKEGFEPFMAVRDNLAQIVTELNETGEVNETLFGQIDKVLGKHNKELANFLRAQVGLQAVQKKVAEAEAKGFIPAELKKELAQAEEKVEKERELMEWQQETKDLQKEFLGGMDKAAKAMGKAASAAGAAAKAQTKQIQTLEEWYARERELIEQKYELGLLGEEEYLRALLNLETQYVSRSLEEGVGSGLESHMALIRDLETQLDAFKTSTKSVGEEIKKGMEVPSPADLLRPFADLEKPMQEVGQQLGEGLMFAFQGAIPETIPTLLDSIWKHLRDGLVNIFNNLKTFVQQNVTPKNFPMFALLAGLLAQLAASPVLGFLTRLGGLLGSVTGATGGLLPGIIRLVSLVGRFSLIGGAIILIFMNWETIVATLTPLVERLAETLRVFAMDVLGNVIEKLGGTEVAIQKVSDMFGAVQTIIVDLGNVFSALLTGGGLGDLASAIGSAFSQAIQAIPTGGISAAVSTFFSSVFSNLEGTNIGTALNTLFNNAISGLRDNILPTLTAIFSGVGQSLVNLVPPGVVEAITQVADQIKAFFEQGRLGGELALLFQELGKTMYELGKIFGPIVIVALAAVADVVLSLLQTLGDILPYIEGILAGVIRTVRGVIMTIEGIAQVIIGIFLLLTGKTDEANAMLATALGNIAGGFTTAFSGIVLIVENALAGVVAAVISFVSHLFENVNLVTGIMGAEPIKWIQSIHQFRIDALAAIQQFANDFRQFVVDLVNSVIGFFTNLKEQLVGGSIIPEMVTAILTVILGLRDQFIAYIEELVISVLSYAIRFLEVGTAFVSNIQKGIETAWQGLVDFVTGKVDALFGPILDVMSKIPGMLDPGQLQKAGANMVDGVKTGIEGTWGSVINAFSNQTQELQEPVEATKTGILGIFQGLQSDLVGNSIIPDTTLAIVNSFSMMNTTLQNGLRTFINYALNLWRNFTNQMMQLWQVMVSTIISLAQQMEDVLTSILERIVSLFDDWKKAVDDLLESLDKLPEVLIQIGETEPQIRKLVEAFTNFADEVQEVRDQVERLIEGLKRLQDLGGGFNVTMGGGPTGYQHGAWRIPHTGIAMLHEGETVLPSSIATNFRALMNAISRTGINGINLGLPTMGTPALAMQSPGNNQYTFEAGAFAGAFPSVRDGRDASSFLEQLDQLTSRGSLRGKVVG